MASKIERELTPEEVVTLLETLAKTPGGKILRVIQEEARKRGIEVSLMGAAAFRDAALHPYITKLQSARHKSQMLAEAVTAGDESGLLAGARTALAEQVVDFLMTEAADKKQFTSLAKTLSMLSTAQQGDKLLTARLREYEAKDEQRRADAAKLEERKSALSKKSGVSQEAIELMEEALHLLG